MALQIPQWPTAFGDFNSQLALPLAIVAISMIATTWSYLSRRNKPSIPYLSGTIPRLSITLMYMTDMKAFLAKARSNLRQMNIVQYHLGPMKAYIVTGATNVQTMFRTSAVDCNILFLMVYENIWAATKDDLAKWRNDKSGRSKIPTPEKHPRPENKRYWAGMHHLVATYLTRTSEAAILGQLFQKSFAQRIEQFPIGQATTLSVYKWLLKDMAMAAVKTVNGQRILDETPNLLDLLWDFDVIVTDLLWGLPRFLNRESWRKRERFHDAVSRYMEGAIRDFDWAGVRAANPDWEPVFGSRFTREYVEWCLACEFSLQTITGSLATLTIYGANANSVPVTAWCIMEIAKDQALLEAVREEVKTVFEVDEATGQKTAMNTQKLMGLPLLQSIYTEGLRLHVSMNVTRQIIGPLEMGGVKLDHGAALQAATEISHYNEEVWGSKGHPASEFWPERHVKYVDGEPGPDGKTERVRQFVLAGGPNDFFPYGGGLAICPGRFFAKQEIMLTIAMFVSRFDIVPVGWVNMDGTPSDRPAKDDARWSGGASVPPDRDLKVTLKRLW